ncbi:MAG: hypothetical protein AVDCRST_MAG18-4516, partial [uncultured Thermomicrobiales bacterium]
AGQWDLPLRGLRGRLADDLRLLPLHRRADRRAAPGCRGAARGSRRPWRGRGGGARRADARM